MVKCSEAGEILFQKLLEKLVTRRLLHPLQMMQKWSILGLSQLLLRKTDEFLSFKKEEDRLDVFIWRYIGAKS